MECKEEKRKSVLPPIPVETSARHVHLSQMDFETLFGEGSVLTHKADLSQPGQYAALERVTIEGSKGAIEKVAVLGPFRSETQVEISISDSRKLGVQGMIRQSGDTKGTPGCRLIGPKGMLDIDHGVIVAKRHIHMTPADAAEFAVTDNEVVYVSVKDEDRSLIFSDVVVRVREDFALAMHVDTDEANACGGKRDAVGVICRGI